VQTYAERILGRLAGRRVRPGEVICVRVDRIMAHDGSAPVIARTLARHGFEELRGAGRAVFVFDHFFPAANLQEAALHAEARKFAARYGIPVFEGRGIAHQILPERGLVAPGTVFIGGDSHTCTAGAFGAYATGMGATDIAAALVTGRIWLEVPQTLRVRLEGDLSAGAGTQDLVLTLLGRVGIAGALGKNIEFVGEGALKLSLEARKRLANHSVEMGATSCIFGVDGDMLRWLETRGAAMDQMELVEPGHAVTEYDCILDMSEVEASVALPSQPDRVVPIAASPFKKVDQVFIGSCAGGELSDLQAASAVLRGYRIAPGVRLLVGPASNLVLVQALSDGTIESLVAAGATILPPGCGACLGRLGTLHDGEVAVATQNRNFAGRAGSAKAEILLASATVAAWAARRGWFGPGVTGD
jgi:3-isopropylmalate/(R)-2-methylmalate dehydratase large subunit